MEIEKPGFHTPLTIKETIDAIYRKKYLLPSYSERICMESGTNN